MASLHMTPGHPSQEANSYAYVVRLDAHEHAHAQIYSFGARRHAHASPTKNVRRNLHRPKVGCDLGTRCAYCHEVRHAIETYLRSEETARVEEQTQLERLKKRSVGELN